MALFDFITNLFKSKETAPLGSLLAQQEKVRHSTINTIDKTVKQEEQEDKEYIAKLMKNNNQTIANEDNTLAPKQEDSELIVDSFFDIEAKENDKQNLIAGLEKIRKNPQAVSSFITPQTAQAQSSLSPIQATSPIVQTSIATPFPQEKNQPAVAVQTALEKAQKATQAATNYEEIFDILHNYFKEKQSELENQTPPPDIETIKGIITSDLLKIINNNQEFASSWSQNPKILQILNKNLQNIKAINELSPIVQLLQDNAVGAKALTPPNTIAYKKAVKAAKEAVNESKPENVLTILEQYFQEVQTEKPVINTKTLYNQYAGEVMGIIHSQPEIVGFINSFSLPLQADNIAKKKQTEIEYEALYSQLQTNIANIKIKHTSLQQFVPSKGQDEANIFEEKIQITRNIISSAVHFYITKEIREQTLSDTKLSEEDMKQKVKLDLIKILNSETITGCLNNEEKSVWPKFVEKQVDLFIRDAENNAGKLNFGKKIQLWLDKLNDNLTSIFLENSHSKTQRREISGMIKEKQELTKLLNECKPLITPSNTQHLPIPTNSTQRNMNANVRK